MDKKVRTFAERETASKGNLRIHQEPLGTNNNNNQGNQGGRNNAPARVYAVGRVGTDPDANVVTVPGAAPVARAPYRLAPSEMKELAK
nr:hypothetical protein [Tanacetum cinerariifolium]